MRQRRERRLRPAAAARCRVLLRLCWRLVAEARRVDDKPVAHAHPVVGVATAEKLLDEARLRVLAGLIVAVEQVAHHAAPHLGVRHWAHHRIAPLEAVARNDVATLVELQQVAAVIGVDKDAAGARGRLRARGEKEVPRQPDHVELDAAPTADRGEDDREGDRDTGPRGEDSIEPRVAHIVVVGRLVPAVLGKEHLGKLAHDVDVRAQMLLCLQRSEPSGEPRGQRVELCARLELGVRRAELLGALVEARDQQCTRLHAVDLAVGGSVGHQGLPLFPNRGLVEGDESSSRRGRGQQPLHRVHCQ